MKSRLWFELEVPVSQAHRAPKKSGGCVRAVFRGAIRCKYKFKAVDWIRPPGERR